ncbi:MULTISPECIES: hemolysin III family protein [unclassified Roseitalea]|uniref:PAQR family membrane homeostasis protein TrhA n=1 Tax=unclassified Roseitalea TaxID=2639107 RepID=UPI00273F074E|nr:MULTISPECIES: hemolysin III family protein [unclassified Roseitalea]
MNQKALEHKPAIVPGMAYPDYTRGERIADGVIHVLAIIASLVAFSILFVFAITRLSVPMSIALIVYGISVMALFCFSAAYHMTPWPGARPLLRRLDQAAIFVKIGGSYTPIVLLIDTLFGYVILTMVWVAALVGAGGKIVFGRLFEGYSVPLYLGLGWASLLLLWPMFATVPFIDAWLVIAGGVAYSVGVIFHQWDGLKYQNAVWHGFVFIASACHFAAITHAAFVLGRA